MLYSMFAIRYVIMSYYSFSLSQGHSMKTAFQLGLITGAMETVPQITLQKADGLFPTPRTGCY
jgi:hypothetical protein